MIYCCCINYCTVQLSSGVEAGVLLVLLFNPLWVVKTRLALQGAEQLVEASTKYTGSWSEFIYEYTV